MQPMSGGWTLDHETPVGRLYTARSAGCSVGLAVLCRVRGKRSIAWRTLQWCFCLRACQLLSSPRPAVPSSQVFSAPCYPQFGGSFQNLGAVAVLGPPGFDAPRFVQYEAAPRPQVCGSWGNKFGGGTNRGQLRAWHDFQAPEVLCSWIALDAHASCETSPPCLLPLPLQQATPFFLDSEDAEVAAADALDEEEGAGAAVEPGGGTTEGGSDGSTEAGSEDNGAALAGSSQGGNAAGEEAVGTAVEAGGSGEQAAAAEAAAAGGRGAEGAAAAGPAGDSAAGQQAAGSSEPEGRAGQQPAVKRLKLVPRPLPVPVEAGAGDG